MVFLFMCGTFETSVFFWFIVIDWSVLLCCMVSSLERKKRIFFHVSGKSERFFRTQGFCFFVFLCRRCKKSIFICNAWQSLLLLGRKYAGWLWVWTPISWVAAKTELWLILAMNLWLYMQLSTGQNWFCRHTVSNAVSFNIFWFVCHTFDTRIYLLAALWSAVHAAFFLLGLNVPDITALNQDIYKYF